MMIYVIIAAQFVVSGLIAKFLVARRTYFLIAHLYIFAASALVTIAVYINVPPEALALMSVAFCLVPVMNRKGRDESGDP